MNSKSIENTVAAIPTQLHNYDVLLVSSANDEELRFAPGNHVGNQRFRVLLSIFRQKYLQANLFGHEYECISIAQEVLETVCNKCVPNGRFFGKGRDNRWQQFGRDSLSTIIMNALKNEPTKNSSFTRSPKRVCRRSSGFLLLYNAASKKLPVSDECVASPNPFDIVCEANGLSISQDCQYTGNNRLKIIFDIRKKSYETSDQEGKQSIIKEIVSSIIDDASGHFLQVDKPSSMYKHISRKLATACIKKALDTATEGEKRQFRESEVKKLVQRKHKKAILDRQENRKRGNYSVGSFSRSPPPTTFTTFLRPNTCVSKAA
mmetsp:Transcript_3583/g.6553  ORF Transcript_3583/g.6553 Transcript_3583/m.6553 type:complete len:319 (-) Transcript_3583:29-985(-)|eukprot:CAMPEP_0201989820 /NCGR_PEP_ID=MMETSP0904-20121228/93054_1 /ASSEMBLY_ACC=CAM_ASM_000553 /TAXON_ID=420261 /ORGANISM="Thalassiosira antarctica, Strain CCMP982" /LENGTH=318 /DNA_ID=CAMNT_0048544059 /DNA_START=59 /DNA_END=1015 /DNA_ORIENTATION=+